MEFAFNEAKGRLDPLAANEAAPLVLLHGLGTGSGIWLLNTDFIIQNANRRIYAIDLLGFARSSRPQFDLNADVEWQLVFAVERWRRAINLHDRFVLVGHGFGAYLCAAYALHFPQHVAHLMLVDAWGLHSAQQQLQQQAARASSHYPLPYWVHFVNEYVLQKFGPLRWLKAAGPWGLNLLAVFRTDLRSKYLTFLGADDADLIVHYLYHCNVQSISSGEEAFKSLCTADGWPKCPIIHRVRELSRRIRLTFVFGSRSWIDRQPAFQIQYLLGEHRVRVTIVQGAGHHVYADCPATFNQCVCDMLKSVDQSLQNPESDDSSESGTDDTEDYSDYDYDHTDEDDHFEKADDLTD
jgi:abhydrolase domain-containing protein 5